jgi:hypothetical protein
MVLITDCEVYVMAMLHTRVVTNCTMTTMKGAMSTATIRDGQFVPTADERTVVEWRIQRVDAKMESRTNDHADIDLAWTDAVGYGCEERNDV